MKSIINKLEAYMNITQMKLKKIAIALKERIPTKLPMFSLQLIVYGLSLNIPATTFFDKAFTPLTIISYGLLYYFLSTEVPMAIKRTRGNR